MFRLDPSARRRRSFVIPVWAITLAMGAAAAAYPELCEFRLTPADIESMKRRAAAGLDDLHPDRKGPLPHRIIPVVMHVARFSDGSGGLPAEVLGRYIDFANQVYAPVEMEFRMAGGIDYIHDDGFASGSPGLEADHFVPGVVNVWIRPQLNTPCAGTFSSVLFGGVYMNGCASSVSAFSHEMGHFFDLLHTHETGMGVECVDGSNCSTAGDFVCDTPADPNLFGLISWPSCSMTSQVADACGSGQFYTPDISNIMSYAPGDCRDHLTPLQLARVRATLDNLRTDLAEHDDCNGNGLPDACDFVPPVFTWDAITRQPFNSVVSFPDYTPLIYRPPAAGGPVVLSFAARADLDGANEWIDIELNDIPVGRVFGPGGRNCPETADVEQIVVPAATFNAALAEPEANGNIVVRLRPSPAVDELCTMFPNNANLALTLTYPTAAASDANGNGVLDTCDPDCNDNELPDPGEPAADCNENRSPDACDLANGGAVLIDTDFENGIPAGWTANGVFTLTSQCGATNTSNFLVGGNPTTCKYSNGSAGKLILPPILLPGGATSLRFRERVSPSNQDRHLLVTVNEQVMRFVINGDGIWRERTVDLTRFHTRSAAIAFEFRSDAGITISSLAFGWQLDDIRVVAGSADCNLNQTPDDCEIATAFSADSGPLGPFGVGFPQSFVIPDAPRALADVALSVRARADFSSAPIRFGQVFLNGTLFQNLVLPGQTPCPEPPASYELVIPMHDFNTRIGNTPPRTASFVIQPAGIPSGPNPFACPSGTFVQIEISYLGNSTLDLDANSIPDICEIPGDTNCDGRRDASDIGPFALALIDAPAYSSAFPGCDLLKADLNGDESIDLADLSVLAQLLIGP